MNPQSFQTTLSGEMESISAILSVFFTNREVETHVLIAFEGPGGKRA